MKILERLCLAGLRAKTAAVLSLCVAVGLTACSLDFGDPNNPEILKNTCEEDDYCPGDGYCSRGMCQREVTELPAFLLATTPPSGAGDIAGLTFFEVVDAIEPEIRLTHPSHIQAVVRGLPVSRENCVSDKGQEQGVAAEDGSLHVRVSLTPRARLLGLPNPPIVKETTLDETGDKYLLDIVAPPGKYDVYVEPRTTDGNCVRPPVLFLDHYLPPNIQPLPIELPVPQALGVVVHYPQNRDELSEWSVAIVERDSGRVLSNQPMLGEPKEVEGALEYSVSLAFSQIQSETSMAAEIVRLSPPPEAVAPTLYIERSIVDLFQDGQGLIDQLTDVPDPVVLGARVAIAGQAEGTPASVNFIATELRSIPPGTVAGFSKAVETEGDGEFELELLPGTYRVRVSPKDETLATLETEVVVSDGASMQRGRTLEVEPRRMLSGRLRNFRGDIVSGITVSAQPALLSQPFNVLNLAQGKEAFAPVSVTRVSDGDGRFSILADPGIFHLYARPQSSSGYAWYVDQMIEIEDDDLSLGDIRLPLPVVIDGTVSSDSGQTLPDALIRAYAFVRDGQLVGRAPGEDADPTQPPADAESVIVVAETRAGADGHYRLLLPSTFK